MPRQLNCDLSQMSEFEWNARVDCAAVHRLVALHGWDDPFFSYASVRLPDDPESFVASPPGQLFDEVTASALVKATLRKGKDCENGLDLTGLCADRLHAAIYAARPELCAIVQFETPAITGVASQRHGLLPITQNALLITPRLAYASFESPLSGSVRRERLVSALGEKKLLILRNQGAIAAGLHPADAFVEAFFLQRACAQQTKLVAGGLEGALAPSPEAHDATLALPGGKGKIAAKAWPSLLRKLERHRASYEC
jgi:ribulose-5-phosphate 4-epimerase/fuculose-1-phosphate aldolase